MSVIASKHIAPSRSLLGISAKLIPIIVDDEPTITELWNRAKDADIVGTFWQYSQALTLLYVLGGVEMQSGRLAPLQ